MLAAALPFGVVLGLAVLIGLMIWQWLEQRRFLWKNPAALLAGGGVFLFYQFWISVNDPVLAGWNAQNQTPSPAVWDLVVSFSPALILAALIFIRWRDFRPNYFQKIAFIWFISSLVLVLVPFSLQRRFLLGFSIPTVLLASSSILKLWPAAKIQRRIFGIIFALSIPSVLVVLLLAGFGIFTRDARLFISTTEMSAFEGIESNTAGNAVILAAPDTGNIIPAQTGRRVLYGHPFETVNADLQKERVVELYQGELSAQASTELLKELDVSYVMFGPREKLLGDPSFLSQLKPVFQDSDVSIYAVN